MDTNLKQPYTYIFSKHSSYEWRDAIIDMVRSLGFEPYDDQTHVTDRFADEITVNAVLGEFEGNTLTFNAGEYFINSITTRFDNEQVNDDDSFYQLNRFLDYCILTATNPPKDLRMHYLTEDPAKGPMNIDDVIIYYPAKKLNDLSGVYRPATSWEINSWLIQRNVISFPKFYFDLFESKVLRKEDYKYKFDL